MVLYIDKENLISLVRSEDKACFVEYSNLIRKNLDIQYNFSKEEIRGDEFLTFWFSQLGSGVGGVQEFCPPRNIVPKRPMKSNFIKDLDASGRSALFFLNDIDKCTAVESKCCVMVSKIGDELSKLKAVFQPDEQGEILTYRIADWGDFLPKLPLSDIIICDNHYFKDKEVYEANENEIIRFLSSIPHESPVNVVIIVKNSEVDTKIELAEEQSRIKDLVKRASGSSKSTVTILTTNKTHDRALITNYYRVKQGSSFHIKHIHVKHDISAEIKTHAIRKNHEFTVSLLNEYQDIASQPVKCIGDKICNYLTF